MGSSRSTSSGLAVERRALDAEISRAAHEICDRYGIDRRGIVLAEMGGYHGGLGNAIPLPIPFRRRYVVRFHRSIRDAEPLALRGLFAHELMHVLHYVRASYAELHGFMARYALFALTARSRYCLGRDWVRSLEHLTDLMAVDLGEGASIAAWKRFKAEATARGEIKDNWESLYLDDADIESLGADEAELQRRIRDCLQALGASHALQPFRRVRR